MRGLTVSRGPPRHRHVLLHQVPEIRWIHLKENTLLLQRNGTLMDTAEMKAAEHELPWHCKSKSSCQMRMAILVRLITNWATELFVAGEVPHLENSSDKWWDLQRLQYGERVGFGALMIQSLSMQITSSDRHDKQNTLCASKTLTVWCSLLSNMKKISKIRKNQSFIAGVLTKDHAERWQGSVKLF